MRSVEAHRDLIEGALADLQLTSELGDLRTSMHYALDGGGKRIRPVLCLAAGEAAGAEPEALLPAATAIELVHSFSLVHDDLPALDDDDERRGRASAHIAYGEGVALLAGDALLAEAFRLALSYPTPAVARELAWATLGMIGGQYLDITGQNADAAALNRLKTGRLFDAAVGCALWVADVPEREHAPWRAFSAQLGALFQLVDDILDGDGVVLAAGPDAARRLADEAGYRAHAQLAELAVDTSVLGGIVDALTTRTA